MPKTPLQKRKEKRNRDMTCDWPLCVCDPAAKVVISGLSTRGCFADSLEHDARLALKKKPRKKLARAIDSYVKHRSALMMLQHDTPGLSKDPTKRTPRRAPHSAGGSGGACTDISDL